MHDISSLNNSKTLLKSLGIEFLELKKDKLIASMPVDERTFQIEGILHGGASAALIETIASVGSYLNIDPSKQFAVGTELNISHLRSASKDKVYGVGTPLRIGKNFHVWEVSIYFDNNFTSENLISSGRCSLFVKDRG
jgi:uncharacterized protein (TIGR00369 family)